jgi:hypothetical protein
MYMGDADDMFPLYTASYCEQNRIQNPLNPEDRPGGSAGPGRRPFWQAAIFPYNKSWDMYFSPSDTKPKGTTARFHNLSYGYNYGYLSKLEVTADPGCPSVGQWFSGRSQSVVEMPSKVVMFASGGGAAFGETTSTLGSMVNPPDAWPSSEYFYGPTEVGWGKSCLTYFQGTKWQDTDGFATRYSDGGNISQTDSSAKFYKRTAAADGTNYDANQSCTLTRVTDYGKYKWDPRYTSGPQK